MLAYIYVRDHESYTKYNAYKLGITNNIIDEHYNYTKMEYIRGNLVSVYMIENDSANIVYDIITNNLKNYELKNTISFYNKIIDNLIENILIDNKYTYIKLTQININKIDDEVTKKIKR